MPKSQEREIKNETTYISRDNKIYRRQIIYTLVGSGEILEGDNDPTLSEFRDLVVGKDQDKNKDGYISKESRQETVG